MKTPVTVISRMGNEPEIVTVHPLATDLFNTAIQIKKKSCFPERDYGNCFYEALTTVLNPICTAKGLCNSASVRINNRDLAPIVRIPGSGEGNTKEDRTLKNKIEKISKESRHKTPEDRLAFLKKVIELVTGKTEEGNGYRFVAHIFTKKGENAIEISDEELLEDFQTLVKDFNKAKEIKKGKTATFEM